MSIINGRQVGGGSPLKTMTFVDENGVELLGIVVDKEVIFDATVNDVKIGKTFASDNGVEMGVDTKTYHTTTASCLVLPGEQLSIPLKNNDIYDYTKFQCIIVVYNSNYSTNVETVGVTLDDGVFSTMTTEKLSNITKNSNTKSIDLNITNDSSNIYAIRYFTYREDTED
jgi:hypothetical protein